MYSLYSSDCQCSFSYVYHLGHLKENEWLFFVFYKKPPLIRLKVHYLKKKTAYQRSANKRGPLNYYESVRTLVIFNMEMML